MVTFSHVFYRDSRHRQVLTDINCRIDRGELVYCVGENGSGKTTFLRLITRELIPASGQVIVMGQDIRELNDREISYFRRRIGIIFQHFRVLWNHTVFENIILACRAVRMDRDDAFVRVCQLLKDVGLFDKKDSMPFHLSYSELRRLLCARALVNSPDMIVADEPTFDMDRTHEKEIMRILNCMVEENKTVIIATRDMNLAQAYPGRVLTISGGKIHGCK